VQIEGFHAVQQLVELAILGCARLDQCKPRLQLGAMMKFDCQAIDAVTNIWPP
jgi:hypothetical protein